MVVQKCNMNDLNLVSSFYDKTILYLNEHINYPKWEYGIYPSKNSTKKAIQDKEQFMCIKENKVLGAFILNDNPQGSYENGNWQKALSNGEYLVIHTLAVDPELYGNNIGQFMVTYCIDYARKNGYKAIRLDVVPDNIPAKHLYEKLGFKHAGTKDLERNIPEIPVFDLYEYVF